MFNTFALKGLRMLGLSVIAGIAIAAPDTSRAGNHYSGGFVAHGGFGGYGYHGGYYGHGYGGYRGFRGYGYRGWGWGYGCCGWGWPTGLFLATLPLYYSTWYWNGVPYYYANDNYYVWDGPYARYDQVTPPQGLMSSGAPGAGNAAATDLFAYPKNGQSSEQQARDRQECRDWAASRGTSGGGATGAIAAAMPQNTEANLRAQTACLTARGYSVK